MLPVNLLMLSELKLVNVYESSSVLVCLLYFQCWSSRLQQRWRVLQSLQSVCTGRRHFSSPGVFTLLVSLSLVVSGMCCSLVGFQLLQSPLTATSLKVLLDGGLIGTFPVFSMRYLMVPSRVFLLQPGVRGALQAYWKAASPGPTCRCLLRLLCYLYPVLLVCGVDMGVLCGPKEFTAYWQNDFELLYRTSLHCASRGSHLWPGTGRVRATRAKCQVSILRTKLGSFFFITLARFSRHA